MAQDYLSYNIAISDKNTFLKDQESYDCRCVSSASKSVAHKIPSLHDVHYVLLLFAMEGRIKQIVILKNERMSVIFLHVDSEKW